MFIIARFSNNFEFFQFSCIVSVKRRDNEGRPRRKKEERKKFKHFFSRQHRFCVFVCMILSVSFLRVVKLECDAAGSQTHSRSRVSAQWRKTLHRKVVCRCCDNWSISTPSRFSVVFNEPVGCPVPLRPIETSGEVWFPLGLSGRGVSSRSKSSQSVLVEADDIDLHFVGCFGGGHADDEPGQEMEIDLLSGSSVAQS